MTLNLEFRSHFWTKCRTVGKYNQRDQICHNLAILVTLLYVYIAKSEPIKL